jgi:hypothetical protein
MRFTEEEEEEEENLLEHLGRKGNYKSLINE